MKILIWIILASPLVTSAQVLNGDFETWTGPLLTAYDSINTPALNPQMSTPDNWTDNYYFLSGSPGPGINRVENSNSGNFALLCHTWYNYAASWVSYMDYSSNRPDYLSGYYMYKLGEADYNVAIRYAEVTIWSNGDTIGTTRFDFDTVSTYTYFQSSITYNSGQTPDSLRIYFYTVGNSTSAAVNSFLFLDDIDLRYNSTSVKSTNQKTQFNGYPNPVRNKLYLNYNTEAIINYEVFNIEGLVLLAGSITNTPIYTEELISGVYFLKIKIKAEETIIKFIKE